MKRRAFTLATGVGLAHLLACGHGSSHAHDADVPSTAAHTVLSLREIDCQSCGASTVEALEGTPGVYQARFDKTAAEVAVAYDPASLQPADLLPIVAQLGFVALEGAGQGEYVDDVRFPPELDVKQISEAGEAVDIHDHRVTGAVTIFDFHAVWCGPCKELDRHLLSVLHEHDDIALRKLNVVDWDSEVAKRYLGNVPELPYVVVYSKKGRRIAEIGGLKLDQLDAAIAKARKR